MTDKITILLALKDKGEMADFKGRLGPGGFEVIEAADGAQALESA
jgi:hypothetical protein